MLTWLIALAAVVQAPATPDLSWMAGYWLDCADGREASETWSDPRGGLMVGHALTMSASGRVSFEVARIAVTPERVAYLAQPSGAAPTVFGLTDSGPRHAVFSNPDNDFPQHIRYERRADALHARIDGEIDGQARTVEWRFQPAPLNSRCPR